MDVNGEAVLTLKVTGDGYLYLPKAYTEGLPKPTPRLHIGVRKHSDTEEAYCFVRVYSNGVFKIPEPVRRCLGITKGDYVDLTIYRVLDEECVGGCGR